MALVNQGKAAEALVCHFCFFSLIHSYNLMPQCAGCLRTIVALLCFNFGKALTQPILENKPDTIADQSIPELIPKTKWI